MSEDKLFAANFSKAFCRCRYYLPLTDLESKEKSFSRFWLFCSKLLFQAVVLRFYWFVLRDVPFVAFASLKSNNRRGEKNHINDIKQIFSFRSRKKGCRRGSKEAIFHIFIFLSFIWLAFRYWMPFVMREMIEKWSLRSLFERFRSADAFPQQLVNDYIRQKLMFKGKAYWSEWVLLFLRLRVFIQSGSSALMADFKKHWLFMFTTWEPRRISDFRYDWQPWAWKKTKSSPWIENGLNGVYFGDAEDTADFSLPKQDEIVSEVLSDVDHRASHVDALKFKIEEISRKNLLRVHQFLLLSKENTTLLVFRKRILRKLWLQLQTNPAIQNINNLFSLFRLYPVMANTVFVFFKESSLICLLSCIDTAWKKLEMSRQASGWHWRVTLHWTAKGRTRSQKFNLHSFAACEIREFSLDERIRA